MGHYIDAYRFSAGAYQHDRQCAPKAGESYGDAFYRLGEADCFAAFADFVGLVV